jgi:7 transmembrane sweet-taste receptor of 3 GCPR
MRVNPEAELNQLGSIRYLGWTLVTVAMFTACGCVGWVLLNSNLQVVKTLQPIFLIMIGVGVFVMTAALIPLSFDDEIVFVRGCDIACMAVPWLFSIGFTIAMSALFSTLANQQTIPQPNVAQKGCGTRCDWAFAVLFSLNFVALLVWTLVDPLRWQRLPWTKIIQGIRGTRIVLLRLKIDSESDHDINRGMCQHHGLSCRELPGIQDRKHQWRFQ